MISSADNISAIGADIVINKSNEVTIFGGVNISVINEGNNVYINSGNAVVQARG